MSVHKVVLVDGKNSLFKMHFAPSLNKLATEEGFPTGSIFGCLNYSILSIAKHLPDAAIVWCWDGEGETWRHKMMSTTPQIDSPVIIEDDIEEQEIISSANPLVENFASSMVNNSLSYLGMYNQPRRSTKPKARGYKANRIKGKSDPKSKFPTDEKQRALIQMPVIRLMLEGAGFRQFEIPHLECDDMIGILTKKIMSMDDECEVYILSGDRDFYQLLKYDRVHIIKSTKGGKLEMMSADNVESEFGVSIKDWAKFRAWTGDSSDNIPHLYKVGMVTARKMLEAGLDPSQSNVDGAMITASAKFARCFPDGIVKVWPAIHGNYKLCKIVTDRQDKLLPEDIQEKLYFLLKPYKTVDSFCRNNSCKNSVSYRKLSYLLAQYEMNSILGRRDELWAIP